MKNQIASVFKHFKSYNKRASSYHRRDGAWDFTGMFLRNQRRWLVSSLEIMVRSVTNVSTRKWPKVIWSFTHKLYELHRSQGLVGVVLYLKTAQLLLMQSMAGMRVENPRILGAPVGRTKQGMPKIIPAHHRARIRRGDTLLLKVWVSLLSLYRVLEFPGTLKLATITDKGKVFDPMLISDFYFRFWGYLSEVAWESSIVRYVNTKFFDEYYASKEGPPTRIWFKNLKQKVTTEFIPSWVTENLGAVPFIIQKASPFGGASTIPTSIISSAQLLFEQSPTVWQAMTTWLKCTGNNRLAEFMLLSAKTGAKFRYIDRILGGMRNAYLGRLGVKVEPAGKLRVFAIVDCWTQWMLKPLHKAIQKLLKRIPQDGTFNQIAPVNRLLAKYGATQSCYSYDLSAATDRLPVSIQAELLVFFIGNSLAKAWKFLLVGRDYRLPNPSQYSHAAPKKTRKSLPGQSEKSIKYSVGQPMGALSSWVMLALTHHLIVQLAAYRARSNEEWYEGYAVLGDDLIIVDTDVADEYLRIMDGHLGVKINVHKSLVSEKSMTLEFAKRFYWRGVDCSPHSFKELKEARQNLSVWSEMGRKYSLSKATLLVLVGFTPRKLRLLSKGLFNITSFRFRKAWDIYVHSLFFETEQCSLDTRSALYNALLVVNGDIQSRMKGWDINIPLPLVNAVDLNEPSEGDTWTSIKSMVGKTFILRPPSILLDFFSLSEPALNRAMVTGDGKLGWPQMASEELYGKDILFHLTKLTSLQNRCEKLTALVVSSSDADLVRLVRSYNALVSEVSVIPKDYLASWARTSPKDEVKSLRDQVRKLRNWWRGATGNVIVMRKG